MLAPQRVIFESMTGLSFRSLGRLAIFAASLLHVSLAEAESKVCDELKSLLPEVSALRGLPIKKEPGCIVLSRSKFLDKRRELYSEDFDSDRLKWEAFSQKALGLIPETYDYERCVLEGSAEDVVAFYDPTSQAVLIPEGDPTSNNVLVHELVHALQDQTFDLSRLGKLARRSTDASLAIGALVEGDAVLVQKVFISGDEINGAAEYTKSADPSKCYPPPLLLEQYEFPYYFGEILAINLYNSYGDFRGINKALENPPLTSKEIVHRQLENTSADARELQPATLPSYVFDTKTAVPRFTDSLGQFTTRLILSKYLEPGVAVQAAKGWKNDTVTVYGTDEKNSAIIAWHTVWMTLEDSEEFFEGIKRVLEGKYGILIRGDAHQALGIRENKPLFLLRSRGRVVELFIGASKRTLP